jgi:putative transposase
MHLVEGEIYHVFNRGNNKQPIFFNKDNYIYFRNNLEKYVANRCDLLAWCLMPNHFHLLIHANSKSILKIKDGSFERQQFSQGIKLLLSSYTKAINKAYQRTGSLFQQKTKAIIANKNNQAEITFHYIHQNPLRAGLVSKLEDWPHNSFQEYYRGQSELCNINLAIELLDLDIRRFYDDSNQVINFKHLNFD